MKFELSRMLINLNYTYVKGAVTHDAHALIWRVLENRQSTKFVLLLIL